MTYWMTTFLTATMGAFIAMKASDIDMFWAAVGGALGGVIGGVLHDILIGED